MDDPVKVLWVTPLDGGANASVTQEILIKFTGPVSAEGIEKVSVVSAGGVKATGSWTSGSGRTEWTFHHDPMKGGTVYRVVIPANIKADNGKEMGNEHVSTFTTEYDSSFETTVTNGSRGSYVTFEVPAIPNSASGYVLRFKVDGKTYNTANAYAVSGFDSANPDACTIDKPIGSVIVNGDGYFEINCSEYLIGKQGQTVTVLIQGSKASGETVVFNATFDSGLDGVVKGKWTTLSSATDPTGGKALKADVGVWANYSMHQSYLMGTTVFTCADIISATKMTEEDYGRKFTVSFKVYDTISRIISVYLTSCTSYEALTIDNSFVWYNVRTEANAWKEVSFDYVVYDAEYGDIGIHKKSLTVTCNPSGNTNTVLWFDDLKCVETVSPLELLGAT
ncbi:MAG: Ig-like domain-containing protein, partial [Clostridia bacterium]|nr:Ig-like domain-containing protein [Clostridia bacterium]